MIRVDPSRLDLREWIRKGDHILVAQGTAEPQTLTEKLVEQRSELGGVNTFLGAMFSDTFQPGAVDGLGLRGVGGVGTNRRLIKAGQMRVVPAHASQIPAFIESGAIGCDVAFVQVSPPDENGRYSLGLAADKAIRLKPIPYAHGAAVLSRLSRFVRAAGQSPGGASIIATENGAVRLRSMDLQQRVRAMIDLAAPGHREALAREARALYGI